MLRFNFLNRVLISKDINIYNLLQIDWSKFVFKNGIRRIKLTQEQCDKFYTVTLEYYNSYYVEDFIYFINKIDDPTDLYPGQEILLPIREDINDFIFQQTGIKS